MQLILKKKNMQTSDRTFNIDEGSTITENYNETLDSAFIRISHISSPIDIEPFDKAILHDEVGRLSDRYMCVDTYTEIMESLDPVLYTYEINLFSETKELENIVLPNLAITQLTDGTHRSVLFYLRRYLELYGPQIRTNSGFISKWHYLLDSQDPEFIAKFNVDCPEMQWNNPTFREVITDLMMVADCIPIKRLDIIDYIDLTKVKDAVDTTKVNYIQRSQSSEDYVSELKMDMQNVMQTQVDNVKQTCTRIENTTFTTDGFVVTDQNYYLKTQFPILRVNHCWMTFQMGVGDGTADSIKRVLFKIDLCNFAGRTFVYEKTEYDTLAIDRTVSNYLSKTTTYLSSHSNYCVYYTRGGNKIEGFSETQKQRDFLNVRTNTLFCLMTALADRTTDIAGNSYSDTSTTIGPTAGNSYFSTFFEIEYETTTDSIFTASKYVVPTHQRVIIDNQTNSYVDAYNQGFMEYQKVNRLGNHQLQINARFEKDYDKLIKIGDYYNDNIVYQTQYQIYKNHIEVNAVATKNYILRDYFTGVKARIRSWKIADGGEALTRHELDKYYLELSFSRKNEEVDVYYDVAYYFLTPIYTGNIWPINKVAVKVDNSRPLGAQYYCLDLIGRIIGNSIVFNFGFDDNFQAGKRVNSTLSSSDIESFSGPTYQGNDHELKAFTPFKIKSSWTSNYGGVLLEPLRYVDNDGEFSTLTYVFSYAEGYNFPAELSEQQEKDLMLLGCQRPVVDYSEVSSSIVFEKFQKEVYKDNREIIKLSTQFEFCADTYDIAFTKKFLEMQQCIRNSNSMYSLVDGVPRLQLFLRQGSISNFNFKNMSISDTTVIGMNADINVSLINNLVAYIDLPNVTDANKAFYITFIDSNNTEQLLIGWTGHTRVYLNVLISRDYNIYDDEGNIVGSI